MDLFSNLYINIIYEVVYLINIMLGLEMIIGSGGIVGVIDGLLGGGGILKI